MKLYIIKIIISAILITIISEVSRKNTQMGSIFASIPLVSLLSILWLWVDTKDSQKIADLSNGILWLVIPSLSFFICLTQLLKNNWNFYLSLGLSLVVLIVFYFVTLFFLKKFNIKF